MAIATALCAVVVLIVPPVAVRTIFAVPLCLVFPGWALTAAVFGPAQLERRQELMLTLAFSLITLVLGSLILDLLPGGLTRVSWTVLLALVVFGAVAVARHRLRRAAPREARRPAIRLRRRDLALLAFAAAAILAAFALSRVQLGARNVVGYTALWMLPAGSQRTNDVDIGVISDELRPATYRLELLDGAGDTVVASRLTLKPGQQARFTVPLTVLTMHPVRHALPVAPTAILYKSGIPGVYRQVTGSIPPP